MFFSYTGDNQHASGPEAAEREEWGVAVASSQRADGENFGPERPYPRHLRLRQAAPPCGRQQRPSQARRAGHEVSLEGHPPPSQVDRRGQGRPRRRPRRTARFPQGVSHQVHQSTGFLFGHQKCD